MIEVPLPFGELASLDFAKSFEHGVVEDVVENVDVFVDRLRIRIT